MHPREPMSCRPARRAAPRDRRTTPRYRLKNSVATNSRSGDPPATGRPPTSKTCVRAGPWYGESALNRGDGHVFAPTRRRRASTRHPGAGPEPSGRLQRPDGDELSTTSEIRSADGHHDPGRDAIGPDRPFLRGSRSRPSGPVPSTDRTVGRDGRYRCRVRNRSRPRSVSDPYVKVSSEQVVPR